jgi:hypothetical protein
VRVKSILFAASLLGAAVHPQSVPVRAPAASGVASSLQRCGNKSSAEEYERKAEQYAAEAEHFRVLADIEERYSRTDYGKYAVRYYRRKANEMDIAAENSLELATEPRMQADAGQDHTASCGDAHGSAKE